jgi:hypothetical protein
MADITTIMVAGFGALGTVTSRCELRAIGSVQLARLRPAHNACW